MTDLQTRTYTPPADGGRHNGNGNGKAAKPSRIPPHDLGAEKDLLGALLLAPQELDQVIGVTGPDDFYKPAHGHIYTAVLRLAETGEPVDVRTVTDSLATTGTLELAGGYTTITDLLIDVPATKNARRYAQIIRSHATRRRLIAIAGEIAEMGYNQTEELDQAIDRSEQLLYNLGDTIGDAAHAEILSDALDAWMAAVERRSENDDTASILTGLHDLDRYLTGFKPGQLITVCGRPGSGKSLFGVQCGYRIADQYRRPVLVVSAEMATEEIVDRIVAAEGRIDNQKLRRGLPEADPDWMRISQVMARAAGVPLFLYDAPNATLASIRAEIRRVTAKAGTLGMVVVDYLQLLNTVRSENRQTEVAELSRGMKRLARDMRVPVVSLAQLNRNLENRADKRPTLADLRESGAIENDSDVVLGVYRDEMYSPESADRGTAELIILKQRGGPTGTVRVAFLGHYSKFENMARM